MHHKHERIIVKIGSQSITTRDGQLDRDAIDQIVRQIASLMQQGIQIVLVTSGAVASGRGVFAASTSTGVVVANQMLAAIGQPHLMRAYDEVFAPYSILTAQILVTKEDFRTRQHYLNIQNTIEGILRAGVLPIVNENDTVSICELMFTDNDELAGLLAGQLSVDRLILLTSVPGLIDGDPTDPTARIIHEIQDLSVAEKFVIGTVKTAAGRGGMQSKLATCLRAARLGIRAHIARASDPDIIVRVCSDELIGTTFYPEREPSARKKWIAQSTGHERGTAWINECAVAIFAEPDGRARSLLPVGVTRVDGMFERGDLIRIVDPEGTPIGIGLAEYNGTTARGFIGEKNRPPLVRYEHLAMHMGK